MSRTTKHQLRFRILVEVMDPEAEEPVRRGLELTLPARSTDRILATRLESLAAAMFGMMENEMDVFSKVIEA